MTRLKTKTILAMAAAFISLVGTLISSALYIFQFYLILQKIGADNLQWFLFWAYVPLSITLLITAQIASHFLKDA